jgi:hypothetical protein
MPSFPKPSQMRASKRFKHTLTIQQVTSHEKKNQTADSLDLHIIKYFLLLFSFKFILFIYPKSWLLLSYITFRKAKKTIFINFIRSEFSVISPSNYSVLLTIISQIKGLWRDHRDRDRDTETWRC